MFMNQLANRILTSMTKFKNFLLNEAGQDQETSYLVNRLNMKLFYVVQSLDKEKGNIR